MFVVCRAGLRKLGPLNKIIQLSKLQKMHFHVIFFLFDAKKFSKKLKIIFKFKF